MRIYTNINSKPFIRKFSKNFSAGKGGRGRLPSPFIIVNPKIRLI